MPQNRSLFSWALALTSSPLAVTRSTERSWSIVRPYLRISQPIPPPRVRPARPVWVTMPAGTASPKACVSPVKFAQPDSRLGSHRPAGQVDLHPLHQGEVDHQPVVALTNRENCGRHFDRHGQLNPASETDGIDDVGHAGASDDERRWPIDPFHNSPMGFSL